MEYGSSLPAILSDVPMSEVHGAVMIVTNTETVAGYDIVAVRGLVQGNTVRAKHAGRDIAAGLKNLMGGELKGYTELLTESRREAMERMLASAATGGKRRCQRTFHDECCDSRSC